MSLNRRAALGLAALAATPVPATGLKPVSRQLAPPDPAEIIRLWPGAAPGGAEVTVTPRVVERSTDPAFHDRFAQYTTEPLMMVLRPELLAALRAAGVRAEAHLFEEGGHGFGIRLIAGKPAAVWPQLALAWGARHGWITQAWVRPSDRRIADGGAPAGRARPDDVVEDLNPG